MVTRESPRGARGGTAHPPKFAGPSSGLPWQGCPILVMILINMSTRERKTPHNELNDINLLFIPA